MLPNTMPGAIGRGALVIMATVHDAWQMVENVNGTVPLGLLTPVIVSFLAGPGEAAPPIDITALGQQGGAMSTLSKGMQALAKAEQEQLSGKLEKFEVGKEMTGTVMRYDSSKGFGFIKCHNGGPDVFVHIGDVGGARNVLGLQIGLEVIFTPQVDERSGKYRATNCTDLGKPIAKEVVDSFRSPSLFITGLPPDMTEETAYAVFAQYGEVENLKKLPENGKSSAAFLVRMGTVELATWMVENVVIPTGLTTPVQIKFSENKGIMFPVAGGKKSNQAGWYRNGPY